MDARTLLGTWGRQDYATVDRPKPSWRWKSVYNPLLTDGNNNQYHYTGGVEHFIIFRISRILITVSTPIKRP